MAKIQTLKFFCEHSVYGVSLKMFFFNACVLCILDVSETL